MRRMVDIVDEDFDIKKKGEEDSPPVSTPCYDLL